MKNWVRIVLLLLLGVLVGFINGFLGAGGGMLLVPCIIPILAIKPKVAHATAILIILPICVVSGVIYAIKGAFDFNVFLPCLIGTVVGGVLGTFILSKLKNNIITAIFSVVMIAAGVIMIVKAVWVDFLWLSLIAILSGVFAGMGMGGGTFLIPLLTILMNIKASISQCVNLLVFVPMAIITIIIYAKQKLIDFHCWWIVSVPACIISAVGALVSVSISGKIIKIIFGSFIALIGIVQIIILIVKHVKRKNS